MVRGFATLLTASCICAVTVGVLACEGEPSSVTTTMDSVTVSSLEKKPDVVTAYSGSKWTKVPVEGARPAGRMHATLVCDPAHGQLIMFGGTDEEIDFTDTWLFDLVEHKWSEVTPAGDTPEGRVYAGAAFDPLSEKLYMFGGCPEVADGIFGDLWAYDPMSNQWTELHPDGGGPSAREGLSFVYDPDARCMILFGGNGSRGERCNDTWAYDPIANAWVELSSSGVTRAMLVDADRLPAPRAWHGAAYDSGNRRMVIFGGNWSSGGYYYGHDLRDTWAFDRSTNIWVEVESGDDPEVARDLPSARCWAQMVYDPSNRVIVMAGGGWSLRDTWVYDCSANLWTQLVLGPDDLPASRRGHVLAYDEVGGGVVCFGGRDNWLALNDVWVLTPVTGAE